MTSLTLDHLSQILDYAKEMESLLLEDREHFLKNDLDKITANNSKKTNVLINLANLLESSQQIKMDSQYITSLREHANSLPDNEKVKWVCLLEKLESSINNCQQLIASNSRVAVVNVERIHHLFDKITRMKEDDTCLYEKHGSLTK